MNLFHSILTTCAIVLAIWLLALSQSSVALALEKPIAEKTLVTNVTKVEKKQLKQVNKEKVLHITGITEKIQLVDIQKLWQKFTDRTSLHSQLKQSPERVYVIYKALAKNYQNADVTIGYNVNELRKFTSHVSIDTSQQKRLLPAKRYTETQVSNAWKKINFRQNVDYILEIHHLDKQGTVISTELFVSYK